MAKIAFLLMVHKDPERVIAQARALTAHGDCVAIHMDARMAGAAAARIREGLAGADGIVFARRLRCGWGEWSLVRASLRMIRAARGAFTGITHYFLISGDCMPTKSRGYLDRFLADGRDHIEAADFFETGWIKTGLREDRLIYRHWFNERAQKRLFYASLALQRWTGMRRALPRGVRIHIGSQWWVLRAATVERLLGYLAKRRDLVRFFRTTWIPDETFFQTLVARLVPEGEIAGAPPTTLLFSDYGMPVVFYPDHHAFLRGQPHPFARKISAAAPDFDRRLLAAFAEREAEMPEGGATTALYPYLTGRGRTGGRYARRFWERAIEPRREAEVLIVAAKLWHIGHAVERIVARSLGLTALGYVFDEDRELPLALGNLERGLFKRNRHRRALLNQILAATDGSRILFSVDPSRLDVVEDAAGFGGAMRILSVERPLSERHIRFHAERVGLLHPNSGPFERTEAMRALTREFAVGDDALRARYADRIFVNALERSRDDNVVDIGHFLQLPRDRAEVIARETEALID